MADAAPPPAPSTEAAQQDADVLTSLSTMLLAVRQQAAAGAEMEAELGAEIAQLRTSIRWLQGRNAELESSAKAVAPRAPAAGEDKERELAEKLSAATKDNAELTSRLDSASESNAKYARRLVELERSHTKLITRLYESEKKNGNLTRKLRVTVEQLAVAKASKRSQPQDESTKLKEHLKALEAVNAKKRGEIDTLNTSLQKLQAEYQVAFSMLASVTQNSARIQWIRAPEAERQTTTGASSSATINPDASASEAQSASEARRDVSSSDGVCEAEAAENEALQAEVAKLRTELQDAEAVQNERAKLASEVETLRATVKLLDSQLRKANAARCDFSADRLAQFMERSFACTGKTELLSAAFVAYFAGKELEISETGQFAPKPVLLVHQVEIPRLSVAVASAEPNQPGSEEVESSQPGSEEVDTRQAGTREGEQSEAGRGGDQDPPSDEVPDISHSNDRDPDSSERGPEPIEQQVESPPPQRTASDPLSPKPRRPISRAQSDGSLLPPLSNGGQNAIRRREIVPTSLASPALSTVERGRISVSHGDAIPVTLVSHERQRREESMVDEEVGSEDRRKRKRSQEGDVRDRHEMRLRRRAHSQGSSQSQERATSSTTKNRRQAEWSSRADAAHSLLTSSDSSRFSARIRARTAPERAPANFVRSEPPRHAGVVEQNEPEPDSMVSINEIDLRLLYEQKPWEEIYEKRPLFSYTVNYSSLSSRAKKWVEEALAFRTKYRREVWEQQHWVVVARPDSSPGMVRLVEERRARQAQAQLAWNDLVDKADEYIQKGWLPSDVWLEPFLWRWTDQPRRWIPSSCNLIEELEALDALEPARCFYVDGLRYHPFFTGRLAQQYREPKRLPPGF